MKKKPPEYPLVIPIEITCPEDIIILWTALNHSTTQLQEKHAKYRDEWRISIDEIDSGLHHTLWAQVDALADAMHLTTTEPYDDDAERERYREAVWEARYATDWDIGDR